MSVALLFALALAVQPPPASAPPVTTTAPAKAPAPSAAQIKVAGDPDEKICRSEQERGSRIATRTCRSRAQWAALELGASDYLRERRELAAPGR